MFGNALFVSFQTISVLSTDKVPFHTELFMYVELKQKLLVGLFPARQQGEIGISEDPPNNMISPRDFWPRKKPLSDLSSSGIKE